MTCPRRQRDDALFIEDWLSQLGSAYMPQERLQLQRFELKYIIRPKMAWAVRDFVSTYLELDEFGAAHPDLSYPVHSLYLDSDGLDLYWHTINGNKNRYKLRLRFYDGHCAAPVYFEIKRRMNDAILKQRGAVRRDAVDWLLAGQLPEPAHLISPENPQHLAALQRFCQLINQHHARPKARVSYAREAWISPHNNDARVTMDRSVMWEPDSTTRLCPELKNAVLVFGSNVVLELKFTGRFPNWFRELVRVFGLVQCSAAKYVDGLALTGENRVGSWVQPPGDAAGLQRVQSRKELVKKHAEGGLMAKVI